MSSLLPWLLLAGAVICSLVGRVLLMSAAFGVSVVWGVAVMIVPFAPMFFRLSYPQLATRARYFRMGTLGCSLLFVATGGSSSISSLKPHASRVATHKFQAPVASTQTAAHSPATKFVAGTVAAPAAATPAAAPAATPAGPSLAERQRLNIEQIAKLKEWYANLAIERRDLLKADVEGIHAFNVEAAQYQDALKKAVAEQAEIQRLSATASK